MRRILSSGLTWLWALVIEIGLAFISRPLALVMSLCYVLLLAVRHEHRYPTVPRIVADRAKSWYLASLGGLFLWYLMLAVVTPEWWSRGYVAAGLAISAILTIAFPVGDLSLGPFPSIIRNFAPVLSGVTLGERRVFMSQMSLRHLLHAGREGAFACVIEGIIGYAEIIGVAMVTLRYVFDAPGGHDAIRHPVGDGSNLFDFFYFTITTVTTIGYGDWSPKSVVPKGVCVGTVILAIAYVGAILTPAFGIAAQMGNKTASLFRIRRRQVIEDASRFLLALRADRRSYPAFATSLREAATDAPSQLALKLIAARGLSTRSDWQHFFAMTAAHLDNAEQRSHTTRFAEFGPHWEIYGALSDLVGNRGYTEATEMAIRSAVAHRCYGDILLASAIAQLRDQAPISYIPTGSLRWWLHWQRRRAPMSHPVADLNIWHTALAFRLLVASPDADAEGMALHDIANWLFRARIKDDRYRAWSWSTLASRGPRPIVCVDTTSVIYEGLASWTCSHLERRQALTSAERFLAEVEARDDTLVPSLVWTGGETGGCPIVTARVVSLLPLPLARVKQRWQRIVKTLERANSSPSPWHAERSITVGLVASYLPTGIVPENTITAWAAELIDVVNRESSCLESLAAAVVGLFRLRGLTRNIQFARKMSAAAVEGERRLVDLCRAPSDDTLKGVWGAWQTLSRPVCYFGSGRRYVDPLWSATLCASTLLIAAQADDTVAVPTSVV